MGVMSREHWTGDFILDSEFLRSCGWGVPFLRPSALVSQRQQPGSSSDTTGSPCSMLPPPRFWVPQIESTSSPLLPLSVGLVLATLRLLSRANFSNSVSCQWLLQLGKVSEGFPNDRITTDCHICWLRITSSKPQKSEVRNPVYRGSGEGSVCKVLAS